MNPELRNARLEDVPALERLIEASARQLCGEDYTREQIEGALGSAWGVDRQLIRDGTYFVVECGGGIAACGGWSKRKALFGADRLTSADPELLDPNHDAARIRAFFVHPAFARQGLGRSLLSRCEREASAMGFSAAELVATLPGERLYAACGYHRVAPLEHMLAPGLTINFVQMRKAPLILRG